LRGKKNGQKKCFKRTKKPKNPENEKSTGRVERGRKKKKPTG